MSLGKLTPLGAEVYLRNDPRRKLFTTTDYRILFQLILHTDKKTGVTRLTQVVWEDIASNISQRTVTRSFAHLSELGLLIYYPGKGRANCGEVHLAFRNWGDPEKVTAVSGFSRSLYKDRARDSNSHREVVKCTQPFSDPASPSQRRVNQPSPESASKEAVSVVRLFHKKAKTPAHRLNRGFLAWEYTNAQQMLDEYSSDTLRRAWDTMWIYYERTSRRKKPQQIGLLRFYCKHLTPILKDERTRKRIATLKRRKDKKAVENWQERYERVRKEELADAIDTLLINPASPGARDTLGLEPLFLRGERELEEKLLTPATRRQYFGELALTLRQHVPDIPDADKRRRLYVRLNELVDAAHPSEG